MLSISKISDCEYYLELGAEDYYTKGGEPPGKWIGDARGMCGVYGKVAADDLRSLFDGYQPLAGGGRGKALVQNAAGKNTKSKRKRQAAWDCTFSAPKSLSVLWAVSPSDVRQKIQAIQQKAVERVFKFMEDELAWTRRGKGGSRREQVSLLGATFEHGTSRELDPQLHTHLLLLNIGLREDRSTGSITSRPFFVWRDTLGALYRTELSALMENELGVLSTRDRDFFAVLGIPDEASDQFSTRRKQVLALMKKYGMRGGESASKATGMTRREKGDVPPREELFKLWKSLAGQSGVTPRKVAMLLGRHVNSNKEEQKPKAIASAIERLEKEDSFFSERQLIQHVAIEGQARGLDATDTILAAREHLKSGELIKLTTNDRRETIYATPKTLEMEQGMVDLAHELHRKEGMAVCSKVREKVFKRYEFLSSAQKAAVNFLTRGETNLCLVSGVAGAGKTTALKAAVEMWQAEGLEVVGAAPTGQAAKVLAAKTGIKTNTIHRQLGELGLTEKDRLRHYAKMTVRAAKGQKVWGFPGELPLKKKKSVLVVDEAGMIGTRQMADLLRYAEKYNAMLVLLGDDGQLQSIEPGGPFHSLLERLSKAEINEVQRQNENWEAVAVKLLKEGDARTAFSMALDHSQLKLAFDREHQQSQVIQGWAKLGVESPEKSLIIASTNDEVEALNDLCQQKRRLAGKLGRCSFKITGTSETKTYESRVHVRDRIMFTRNAMQHFVKRGKKTRKKAVVKKWNSKKKRLEKSLKVTNGTKGRVIGGSFRGLLVKTDEGDVVRVCPKEFPHLRRAYAMTIYKVQGSTFDEAHAILGADREATYVQASRAAKATRLYAIANNSDELLSDEPDSVASRATRSAIKGLAIDLHHPKKAAAKEEPIECVLSAAADPVEDSRGEVAQFPTLLSDASLPAHWPELIAEASSDYEVSPPQRIRNADEFESGRLPQRVSSHLNNSNNTASGTSHETSILTAILQHNAGTGNRDNDKTSHQHSRMPDRLNDGRLSISNSVTLQAIKPKIVGREQAVPKRTTSASVKSPVPATLCPTNSVPKSLVRQVKRLSVAMQGFHGNTSEQIAPVIRRHHWFGAPKGNSLFGMREAGAGQHFLESAGGKWLLRYELQTTKTANTKKRSVEPQFAVAALCHAFHAKGKVAVNDKCKNPDSFFQGIELPVLLENEQVTHINELPRTAIKQKVLTRIYDGATPREAISYVAQLVARAARRKHVEQHIENQLKQRSNIAMTVAYLNFEKRRLLGALTDGWKHLDCKHHPDNAKLDDHVLVRPKRATAARFLESSCNFASRCLARAGWACKATMAMIPSLVSAMCVGAGLSFYSLLFGFVVWLLRWLLFGAICLWPAPQNLIHGL